MAEGRVDLVHPMTNLIAQSFHCVSIAVHATIRTTICGL
jgi:hypothetical protein